MAHPDLDLLLNALIPFAEQMLVKHSEFLPFAASVRQDGSVTHVAGATDNERPPSQEVIDLLTDGLASEARTASNRASGICVDTLFRLSSTAKAQDAICCRLEHVLGEAVAINIPYTRTKGGLFGLGGKPKVTLGELVATPWEPTVFRAN